MHSILHVYYKYFGDRTCTVTCYSSVAVLQMHCVMPCSWTSAIPGSSRCRRCVWAVASLNFACMIVAGQSLSRQNFPAQSRYTLLPFLMYTFV